MKVLTTIVLAVGSSLLAFLILEAVRSHAAAQPVSQLPAPGFDHT